MSTVFDRQSATDEVFVGSERQILEEVIHPQSVVPDPATQEMLDRFAEDEQLDEKPPWVKRQVRHFQNAGRNASRAHHNRKQKRRRRNKISAKSRKR